MRTQTPTMVLMMVRAVDAETGTGAAAGVAAVGGGVARTAAVTHRVAGVDLAAMEATAGTAGGGGIWAARRLAATDGSFREAGM